MQQNIVKSGSVTAKFARNCKWRERKWCCKRKACLLRWELSHVNMVQLSDKASAQLIANNTSTNVLYAYNDLDEPQDFNSVIDAIPTDGFNPLWLQKLIVFNAGFTPHQFFSEKEVLAAASGPNPEITLVNTGEIYRC